MKSHFNRIIPFVAILILALQLSTAFAQTTVNGIIDRITPNGIALSSGQTYTKSDNVAVTLPGERAGQWQDLEPGDKVRISFNSKKQAVEVTLLTKLVTQRLDYPLVISDDGGELDWNIKYINGDADIRKDYAIGGRAFPKAFRVSDRAVFPNYEDCNLLDVWISATDSDDDRAGVCRILGDGEEIYRSPSMTMQSRAIHVVLPIKGYSGITFEKLSGNINTIGFGNPTFIKLPSSVPNVVSPRTDERVTQITPFLWKPVENATGYLLEMQNLSLADAGDENDVNRYLLLRLPAETTVYNFDANKMPKGKWRWRVHALSKTGFLGEMDEWRSFSSQ